MTPRATYRIQFHKDFGFADAEAIVPYLDRLGISHIYASPVTTAVRGSTHGYDVTDPGCINPELGGEDGLRRLSAALRARDMGLIIDIVPNHMGVAGGENGWWNDVLRLGQASPFACYFDIDWRDKLVLPILGTPLSEALAQGAIAVDTATAEPSLLVYGEHRLALRPEDAAAARDATDAGALRDLLDRQHYRLAWWRAANDELNWRRFFTINELAGLRVEAPEVFEATHALYFRLYREGLIDGVRVDHVDGLRDPAGYCRTLRERLDAIERPAGAPPGPAYIVVEKILGPGEQLAEDWGIDGTSGYDFMESAAALLHDPEGEAPLTALWHDFSGRTLDFEAEELAARQDMLRWSFEAQLQACVAAFAALARTSPETEGLTRGMLRRAIERMLWVFPVYRTYGDGRSAPARDLRVRECVRERAARFTPPGEAGVVDRVLAWLAGEGPGDPECAAIAVTRFQQLSAPIAAKSVEDTAFYRYGRLLSRTDVGFDAARFSLPFAAFHAECTRRAERWPGAMLATATHDHKRGEDMRARLAVLSEVPQAWRQRARRWDELAGERARGVDPADRYMLYQTLFGAWPADLRADDGAALAQFADRAAAWQQKALREAKLRSSWEAPDSGYEQRCADLARRLLDPGESREFLAELQQFVGWTAAPTLANMLGQLALRYTVPGMPDCYQGSECADFSLVDPDNRRPVDYAERERLLEGVADRLPSAPSVAKFALLRELLALRRAHPDLFAHGGYRPLAVHGPRAHHVLAFRREHEGMRLTCVIALRCAEALVGREQMAPDRPWWGETRLEDAGIAVADLLANRTVFMG